MRNKESKVTLLGEKPKLKEAPEPTNILWENREKTLSHRVTRTLLAIGVIGILLAISFSIILELKTIARSTKYKYQKASCNELKEIYTDEML